MIRNHDPLTINRLREGNFSTFVFDCGAKVTYTTISNYSRLRMIKQIEGDVSSVELIKKLDSLESEPAVEFSDASGARLHIKKLMRS